MNGMLILNYRSGSNYLLKLMMGREDQASHPEAVRIYDPGETQSSPRLTMWQWLDRDSPGAPEVGRHGVVWHDYVGDWWGEVNSPDEVPDPVGGPVSPQWGVSQCESLPGGGWRFIYLVRDPRHHLASMMAMTGEQQNPLRLRDPMAYFRIRCLAVRNRMLVAANCRRWMNNFRILRFEDLIRSPVETVGGIMRYLGVEPDDTAIQAVVDREAAEKNALKTSMYTDTRHDHRDDDWTDEMVRVYREIMLDACHAIGYTV